MPRHAGYPILRAPFARRVGGHESTGPEPSKPRRVGSWPIPPLRLSQDLDELRRLHNHHCGKLREFKKVIVTGDNVIGGWPRSHAANSPQNHGCPGARFWDPGDHASRPLFSRRETRKYPGAQAQGQPAGGPGPTPPTRPRTMGAPGPAFGTRETTHLARYSPGGRRENIPGRKPRVSRPDLC